MHHRTAQLAFNLYPRPELGYYECGRDLFTFVTVASTHIMRTLQKPKKSRPTKRKVNHRRFLQNQIYRKYSVIEAATQQLATTIFSQEAVAEKQNPANKPLNYSAVENRSTPLKDIRKEKITPLQNVINLSSNLPMLPDGHLDSTTFLGVAEAYLVPDTISKLGISLDTLACVSDEVGTVESLFDNIITEDEIFSSTYGLLHPTTHHLHKNPRTEHDQEATLQTGLIFCDTGRPSWFLESFDKSGYQLPSLQTTTDSAENTGSAYFSSNPQSDPEIVLHGILTPDDGYNAKSSPKMSSPEKGYNEMQTNYEWDPDIDSDDVGCSFVHLTKGIPDTLPDVCVGKELELQPDRTKENLDYGVFWASAKEPNTINIYRTLCLNPEDNDNFLCSSW